MAVAAYVPGPRPATLYLMNADGSDRDLVTEGVVIEHVLGSPGLVWSPDGTGMAYATLSGERELQIWNGSPDGSTPVLVFESAPAPGASVWTAAPVWSPDGTRIAFPFSTSYLVANADGMGDAGEIDELRYLSWRGGWYFCECYG
jgi:Tol biopolymer transport system component